MRFADPWALVLILLVLPVYWFGRGSGGRIRYSSVEALKGLQLKSAINPRSWLLLARCLAIVLLVVGLARPQAGKSFSEVSSEGIDIMLVLDTSGSMQALDFKVDGKAVTRLSAIQKVAGDFIRKRPGDRIGIVVFGEEAYTQCPLTLDHGIAIDFLSRLEIGMAGDATAIGSGLGTAISRVKGLAAKSKVMVLMTDGSNNAGRMPPLKAAEIAGSLGIKVYTIGIGTRGEAPFLVKTPFGNQYVYQRVEIDENTLTQIAAATKARYFRATDTEKLSEIYGEIDQLEKTEVKVKEYTEYRELFIWFVLAAVALILLEAIIGNTLLRKIP